MISEIENMGGIVRAVEKGWVHNAIAQSAYRTQKALENKEFVQVGVNEYVLDEEEEEENEIFEPPETLKIQEKKIKNVKEQRDNAELEKARQDLERACENSENLVVPTIKAITAMATLGEITEIYKKVFGTWSPRLA